ncbi:DnaD domain protein [Anaerovorax odorimutans]|uniref:DnaD domain protein n=1 Tax=Anaerovorax odorimutans TaxID=109327 RepID=UPI0003FF116A|nr:DnaD domain protein [Anaerovorax odorimutans]
MNFIREQINDYYLRDTHVENIFINEYMAGAPGDYVKVYLFALMYAGHDMHMNNEAIAKQLNMAIEDVLKAWSYWENMGVIKKHYEKPTDKLHYKIEFLSLKDRIYIKGLKDKKSDENLPEDIKDFLGNDEIKSMYKEIERITGRMFEGKELTEILAWINDYNVSPEIIIYAYAYCVKKRKHSNHKYIAAIVKKWADEGLKNVEQVEAYLEETDNRHYLYKRVLKALGFMRNPTEGEKAIIDSWLDEMNFGIEKILEACNKTTGISNPNLNYINSILKAWHSGNTKPIVQNENSRVESKPNNISLVMKSYEETRERNKARANARREEVYFLIPEIKEIEEESREIGIQISKVMLSGAFDTKSKIKSLKQKAENLNNEKAYLLTENNFKIDYMDIEYDCDMCKDTGIKDTGERCSCFSKRLDEIQKMF